jgi:hypothetical protein
VGEEEFQHLGGSQVLEIAGEGGFALCPLTDPLTNKICDLADAKSAIL